MTHRLAVEPLPGLPEIAEGDDLAAAINDAAEQAVATIGSGDVLVVAQKAVSKSEGMLRALDDYRPSDQAIQLADSLDKDPRLVQAILDESNVVIRAERGVLITRTHHGFVCANAGIDQSNVPGDDIICLLPSDPDRSARELRARLSERSGHLPAIVISDSFGRAWRVGQSEIAVGCAGLAPLHDRRGERDTQGRELTATIDAVADDAAAAAGLVRDKHGGQAVVIVRGLERYVSTEDGPGATSVVRPIGEDLFG